MLSGNCCHHNCAGLGADDCITCATGYGASGDGSCRELTCAAAPAQGAQSALRIVVEGGVKRVVTSECLPALQGNHGQCTLHTQLNDVPYCTTLWEMPAR